MSKVFSIVSAINVILLCMLLSTHASSNDIGNNNGKPNFDQQTELDIMKRIPNGFVGMRGKKIYEANNDIIDWEKILTNSPNNVAFSDYSIADVRRLKSDETDIPVGNFKKLLRDLNAQRNREGLMEDFLLRNIAFQREYETDDIEKRAPAGFIGMRGKRAESEESELLPNDEDTELEVGAHRAFKRSPLKKLFGGFRAKRDKNTTPEPTNGPDVDKFPSVRG